MSITALPQPQHNRLTRVPRSRIAIIISALLAAFTILFTGAGSGCAHTVASLRQGGGLNDNVAHDGHFKKLSATACLS